MFGTPSGVQRRTGVGRQVAGTPDPTRGCLESTSRQAMFCHSPEQGRTPGSSSGGNHGEVGPANLIAGTGGRWTVPAMSSISPQETSRLVQRLGVDTTDAHQAATFDGLIRRYGPQLASALHEGWFDPKPVLPATAVAYRRKYARFERWAKSFGLCPLPASEDAVEEYAQYRLESGAKASTIGRELDAVDWMHRNADHPQPGQTPRLREWKQGAARDPGQDPTRQSFPLQPEHIRALVRAVKRGAVDWQQASRARNNLKRLRTISLFLFLFATGMRISDAVRVKASWITVDNAGWARIQMPRSKNHPDGVSYRLYPAADSRWCPVRALVAWMEAATAAGGLPNGRLFPRVKPFQDVLVDPLAGLSGEELWIRIEARVALENVVLADAANHAGIGRMSGRDPVSSRSFRRGLATAAREAGAEVSHIQRSLGHRLHATTVRYIDGSDGLAEGSAVRVVLG